MVFRNGFCNGFRHEIKGFRHRFRNMDFVLCNRWIGFRNRSAERTADGWAAKRAGLIQFLHDRLPFTMLKIKPHCVSTRKAAGWDGGGKTAIVKPPGLRLPDPPAIGRNNVVQLSTAVDAIVTVFKLPGQFKTTSISDF